ncbi:unnamed protein product [Cladocopium goreaui]|uniref:Uncharacterized protein n=1 Tax=Cladocopium goreaui TaxID=2562237 RepID=A0A9P1FLL5_9DINO|nr:unnamed protein product [Cladocopium goreaui]
MSDSDPGPAPPCEKCGADSGMHFWDPKLQLWRSRCAGVSIHPLKQTERKSPHESFTPGAPVPWFSLAVISAVAARAAWVKSLQSRRDNMKKEANKEGTVEGRAWSWKWGLNSRCLKFRRPGDSAPSSAPKSRGLNLVSMCL